MDVLERWLRFGLPVLSLERSVVINREAWEKRCEILISNVSLQLGTIVLEPTYFDCHSLLLGIAVQGKRASDPP